MHYPYEVDLTFLTPFDKNTEQRKLKTYLKSHKI